MLFDTTPAAKADAFLRQLDRIDQARRASQINRAASIGANIGSQLPNLMPAMDAAGP